MFITLIRHSKTILEKEIPNPLWQLSDEGIDLATRLSEVEAIKNIDILYSSLQTKALQTSLLLSKDNQIPIKTHPDLTELTSITVKFIEDYEKSVEKLYSNEINRINGGETIEEGMKRFSRAIEEIVLSETGSDNVGVVAHGNILSIFASQFTGKSPYEIHQTIQMPDLAIFDYDRKQFTKFFGEIL